MRNKAVMCWSCGKDSAIALWTLQQAGEYEIVGLLTTLTEGYDRVSMSGVRRELLQRQASALGLPVDEVWIPPQCVNPVYEARMGEAVQQLKEGGVAAVAFGDLFLEDVRDYREQQMAGTGLSCVFPIWGEDTVRLSQRMIDSGLRATLVCVDPRQVPAGLAGRAYDETLLADLPASADPCGERGEFHTFVWDAPNFRAPIDVSPGEIVERDGFVFADLIPV
ncbi:MAG: adenine nucleotide alpha hydrolase [Chloroflexi bacterium]|nr:MAG: adenine nucleotide alpha hydrolase [Chloroflexota bacterium]TMG01177.1 MAG: adenine nucleotide alpha hydrolase [Chloroflexota bacterium]